MNNRETKLKLLDGIFNHFDKESLKSLSRKFCPSVLIYQEQGKGLLFSGRLNHELPKKYLDRILSEKELDTMLAPYGKSVVFLLPENHR